MYKNKKDIDKQVEKLLTKLSRKEFTSRAFSIARLYFDVGDYANCQIYVEQYLTQKDNNAAAYKLLGQALQKMGQADKALEQFKTSLDIDQTQTSTILDICELLVDGDVTLEPGCGNYWLEKAEAIYPRHPVIFRLREKLVTLCDPDPEALVKLLTMELKVRPKDPLLHSRLLKHYLAMNQFKEAFDHSCNIEFNSDNFTNNYAWYEILDELFKHNADNIDKWLYQLLLLTVKERLTLLSLAETRSGSSMSLVECADQIHEYDQALERVAKAGADPGFAEFHASLLQHHRGQFAFHAATLLLKRAKKDVSSWRDATKSSALLMLMAWQSAPLDTKVNWLRSAPEKQLNAVRRWHSEGTYRCSQSGHYLITNFQDKKHALLGEISQCCTGSHWKEKLYEKVFANKTQLDKTKSSYFASEALIAPQQRLPRIKEVEAYDIDAQKEYGNSLHHFVWIVLNYKNYADFKCTVFDMLTSTITSCGPETLNKLDIYAFLYCATLTARQKNANEFMYIHGEKPKVLPANITDLLCPLPQMKWWDCAYKLSQNILGTELTDIGTTLSSGIEVVRCIDNHGLDPELLCILGRLFSDRAKAATLVEDKKSMESRAGLYYNSAIPLLEKLKSKVMIKVSDKRLFDYTHKEIGSKQLNSLLEECKIFIAVNHINDSEYGKAIEILTSVKSLQAYYHLAEAYKQVALEEKDLSTGSCKSKYEVMLAKAKTYAYKTLDLLKETETNKNLPLFTLTQELIQDIEICLNKIDQNSSSVNDIDVNYSSDENASYRAENKKRTNPRFFRNISSTPKATSIQNNTDYRTAIDSQILETTQVSQRNLERIENEIKNLQKRDTTITDFMVQTKSWFEENRNLGNTINTINSNLQNTTDQFKKLKISVDQVKDQIDECKSECKDVVDLKKQISELKKEVDKLKKSSSEQTINESDLYNLDEDYRTNETTSNYGSQLPFPPQMLPGFNHRQPFPVPPPNPYQLYNQTLYNLYNQYSQFTHSSMPGAQPVFDPARAQMNFPGAYPTPEQMFLEMAHLIPPAAAAAPAQATEMPPLSQSVPVAPTVPAPAPIIPAASTPPISTPLLTSKPAPSATTSEFRDASRFPDNVAMTSSKPLPTSASTPAPVSIHQKQTKSNQPHNYQIAMPTATETNVSSPPVFSFSMPENKNTPVSSNWKPFITFTDADSQLYKGDSSFETSKSVVDGPFAGASRNTSLNKSRTLSEKSNTSVENYDPCPDFKPIIPLPAEVKVTTGEEDETAIFSSRAKLFRFVDKQWKERGIGEIKLLKHKTTAKVRVLMRREQVHKVCANHTITPETEINPMKNESKAYIWAANDFAEGKVVFEKFCIRFKTSDIAKQFKDTFEKARQESKTLKTIPEKPEITTSNDAVTQKVSQPPAAVPSQGKTVVGGFTFTSTPIFAVKNDETEAKKAEPESNKTNVFSNLTFSSQTGTSFSNIFNTTLSLNKTSSVENTNESNKSKLNTSDNVEEFVPTAEFKPVIAMPALVETKTGEEDENALFEHRAKLLRYDSTSKEWKERGLGNIKLLARKDNAQKIRLLMRREQIMKVCCNHVLTKEMIFQKMTNIDKAVTWCAKDFSEGELVAETFCLRFKTSQICDDFINAVQTAQSKMIDEVKEVQSSSIKTQSGFGDKFKAKAGSWSCQGCYTNNSEIHLKCVCCSEPNPKAAANKVNTPAAEPPKFTSWGDQFKPKLGSWECKSCLVRNEAAIENCSACNSPKDPTSKKPTTATVTDTKMNFSFGIPQQTAASIQPPEKSYDCSSSQKATNVFNSNTASSVKFSFGVPPTLTNEEKPKPESSFDGTGASKFSFGIPFITSGDGELSQQKPTDVIYAAPKMPTKTDGTLKFSFSSSNENIKAKTQTDVPADTFASKESGFSFVFNTSSKSPTKSPHKQGNESYGEDLVKDEDCAAHFEPVVPLPDEVGEVTGEENEEELYAHRAKLYIFVSAEWKERGIGIVKILKHKETSKLRVVMRRDQVLKICLNHALTQDVTYKSQDAKTWIFAAHDFSEGKLSLQTFCLRFTNKEIAMQFKNAVENAKENWKPVDVETKATKPDQNDDDDVVFVSQTQANAEDKQKAKDLMLPDNFYMYKHKEPCHGCRGCSEESKSDTKPQTITVAEVAAAVISKQNAAQDSLVTPMKPKLPSFQSPAISIYGTPGAYGTPGNDKTFDTSTFRTPSGSMGSNTIFSTPTDSSDSGSDANNKENVFTQKSSAFSDQRSIFGTPKGAPAPLYDPNDSQTPVNTKSSLLAPPKLCALNVSSENQVNKSIFTSTQAKTLFGEPSTFGGAGISSNRSIFGFAGDKPKEDSTTAVRSLFEGNPSKPSINLFGAGESSIFGPGSLNSTQTKSEGITFGSGELSLFGSSTTNSANNMNETSKLGTIWAPTPSDQNPVIELPMKLENSLSFAALSESGSEFKKVADFKWEGTGQQLFTTTQKKASNNESGDADDTGDAEEEFDPHYEPIVPLPDKIVVSTGEEEEKKVFGERGKMYRYDEGLKEWKERGIGEIKILYHPVKDTYRILLRREQVHKAVLNVLIHTGMELLPMRNSETAWTFVCRNFAETDSGPIEMVAMRFKTVELATSFHDRVIDCVRSLQAAAAAAIREQKEAQARATTPVTAVNEENETKETNVYDSIAPLRLPKHLQENARADMMFTAAAQLGQSAKSQPAEVLWAAATHQPVMTETKPNGNSEESTPFSRVSQQHFQVPEVEPEVVVEEGDNDDEDEENYEDYDYDQSGSYYNEDDTVYKCEGSVLWQDEYVDEESGIPHACIRVMFVAEYNMPKITITDCDNSQLLVDMLVHHDTMFEMTENSCKWTGDCYASHKTRTVTINFFDSDTASLFFENVQACTQSTYYTTDDPIPE